MATKKRGLGRGLDALLGQQANPEAATEAPEGQLRQLPIEFIEPGKYQPRKDMDQETLQELADSIRAQGVMQPIIVRTLGVDRFEIIAGERRWRASQLAGLARIPVIVRAVDDDAAIAMSLIENIQREDLNPMEEARALKRLQDEFELTHQQVAEAVGKSRTAVTNFLRLNNLVTDVATLLEHGDLDMGHARALLALPPEQQRAGAQQVIHSGLNVRQTELLVKKLLQGPKTKPVPTPAALETRRLEEELSESLGQPVAIRHSRSGKGSLQIRYNSLDELDGIIERIRR